MFTLSLEGPRPSPLSKAARTTATLLSLFLNLGGKLSAWRDSERAEGLHLSSFCHANDGEREPVFQRNLDILDDHITFRPKKLGAR